MGLISTEVIVKWGTSNKKWYENKGYSYTKIGSEFEVKVEDLSNGSSTKVDCKCDGCGKDLNNIIWYDYKKQVNDDGKYYCQRCSNKLFGNKKMNETIIKNSKSFEQWCIENDKQDILNRWDYELNDNIKPNEICFSTHKKYYFKCPQEIHESELKNICGFTTGNNKMICNKCNSFAQWCLDNHKEYILDLWDYDKNNKTPYDISYGTKLKHYFKCPRNIHESEFKNINSFTSGYNNIQCNKCNSFSQFGIDNICEDFLEKYWDWELNTVNPWDISKCANEPKVWIKCQNSEKEYHNSYDIVPNSFTGQNQRCPYCNNKHGKVHLLDSLGTLYPEVLDMWSDKNGKTPYEYSSWSSQEAYWKCLDWHEDYKRKISESNATNFRCPKCTEERTESLLSEKVKLYLNEIGYVILGERNCNIIAKNPKTKRSLPYDIEVADLKLICEIHGKQHYVITGYTIQTAKHNNTTPEYELHYQKLKDRYKRIFAKKQGYFYLEIPYWTDDKDETWKQLIDEKINEILNNQNIKEVV